MRNASSGVQSAAALALTLGAVFAFVHFQTDPPPVAIWLVWDFLCIWAWQLFFCAACLSAGHAILVALRTTDAAPLELTVIAMAVGVVVFVLGMYAGGVLGLYGPVFAVALPTSMLIAGIPALLSRWLRASRPRDGSRSAPPPLTFLVHGFGAVGAVLLYLQRMGPDTLGFDATWTHLSIAEDYAREGRIVPFTDVAKDLPHLSSMLYTWAFQVPGFSEPPVRWMLAHHTELVCFAWTLIAVVPAVRRLTGRGGGSASWATYFLFPGFFLWDFNMSAGSDYIAAFFALPFLLATMRAVDTFDPKRFAVAGALAGAALHTKFQCIYLVGPVTVFVVAKTLLRFARLQRSGERVADHRALLLGPLAFGVTTLLTLSPHLVRNFIYFRNPVYPLLQGVFKASRPAFADSLVLMAHIFGSADEGPHEFWPRVWTSLELSMTFPFARTISGVVHVPVFGTLFTLLLPLAVMNFRKTRVLLGASLAWGAVFLWAMTYRVDRNLIVTLPWLVAVSAAIVRTAWNCGWVARAGLVPLVGLHVLWSVPLMVVGGNDGIRSTLDLFQKSWTAETHGKLYESYRADFRKLGEVLPHDALLLLHTAHLRFGIDRRTMGDWAGWQYVIDYRPMRTPRDVYARFRELGITHITWNRYHYPATKQEDVLFTIFTRRYALNGGFPGGFALWEMPHVPPPEGPAPEVLTLGIEGYRDGVYSIEKLGVFTDFPAEFKTYPPPDLDLSDPARVVAALPRVDAVIASFSVDLSPPTRSELDRCFVVEATYPGGRYSVYLPKVDAKCADGH